MKKPQQFVSFFLALVLFVSISIPAFASSSLIIPVTDDAPQQIELMEEIQCGELCSFFVEQYVIRDKYLMTKYNNPGIYHSSGETHQYIIFFCELLNFDLPENMTFDRLVRATLVYEARYEFDGTIIQQKNTW